MPANQKQVFKRGQLDHRHSRNKAVLTKPRLTPSELNARLRFIVGLVLAGILALTMALMLFGLLFVYQGSELSPVDAKFFELMTPVVMFLTGTLSGTMIASSGKQDANNNGIPDDQEAENVPNTEN